MAKKYEQVVQDRDEGEEDGGDEGTWTNDGGDDGDGDGDGGGDGEVRRSNDDGSASEDEGALVNDDDDDDEGGDGPSSAPTTPPARRRRLACSLSAAACLSIVAAAAAILTANFGVSRPSLGSGSGGGAGTGGWSWSPFGADQFGTRAGDDSGPPVDTGRGGGGRACYSADIRPSPTAHAVPVDGTPLSRVAFGSCFIPTRQNSPDLWRHVREEFNPELFVWLGDNMYLDTLYDMDAKRRSYNEAREDRFYAKYGPVAEPKIPITGTWDDHDFGMDNMGKEYPCLKSAQDEFVAHFNLPETDPRHPAQGKDQRNGVYNSQMFAKPGTDGGDTNENGIHVINMDARSHRSPTYRTLPSGKPAWTLKCDGVDSKMLGDTQWVWLEHEMLQRKSIIKLVSSGTQVLPPTHRGRQREEYCSYDGPNKTFDGANADVGEEEEIWDGTLYEGWGEVPQERTRLLRLAQRSIEEGVAKVVIFLTGDQHWAEVHAKRMPPSGGDNGSGKAGGPILYELTASGIDQNYIEDVPNPHRVRVRSADDRGKDGIFLQECNFPFVVNGTSHDDCADVFGTGQPGCSTRTDDATHGHIEGHWGNCLPPEEEVIPRSHQFYGTKRKCTDNYHHTCSARANYGGIVVDWDRGVVNMTLFTPHEDEEIASSIEIDL